MARHAMGDWWFFVKVMARGPRGIWEVGPLGRICDHTNARLLQNLAAGVALNDAHPDPGELLRAAHAASAWAADLDLALADELSGPDLRKRLGSAVPVLAESLHALDQAAHAAAVAGREDPQTGRELRAALVRFTLAFQPLLEAYVGALRRLHANVLAVDPSRV